MTSLGFKLYKFQVLFPDNGGQPPTRERGNAVIPRLTSDPANEFFG
jgi:hypothetical protein